MKPSALFGSVRAGLTRIRLVNLRELLGHRLRVTTSLMVVVVASALLVAVFGTYGSLTSSVQKLSDTISGTADLEVAGIVDSGVDDALMGQIRREVPSAKSVVPLINSPIYVDGERFTVLGSDNNITALSGGLRDAVAEAATAGGTGVNELMTGISVGKATGFQKGQQVSINGVDTTVSMVIDAPEAASINAGKFIFAYLGLAQRLTDHDGRVDSILVTKEPGTSTDDLREQLNSVVDGRAAVVSPDFRAKQAETASATTRNSTLLVSLISLVIAGFLVFNTMNMAVASRRSSIAMIRALGGKRGPLVADLIGEAALFGLVGGLIGVPVGILAGRWAIGQLPEALGSYGATVEFSLPGYAAPAAVIACVLACTGASALAARSVFTVSPIEAMSGGAVAEQRAGRGVAAKVCAVLGVILIVVGWIMANRIQSAAVATAGIVFCVGMLLVCYAITRPLVAAVSALASRFGGPGTLSAVNTERAPRRAWATLMTVAVAITVGLCTSGVMNNLVSSITNSLDGLGDTDFYVSTQDGATVPDGPILDPAVASAISEVPGVEEVVGGQWASVNIGESLVMLQGLDPGTTAPFVTKGSPEVIDEVLAGRGIIMSQTLADNLDAEVGDPVEIASPTGYHSLPVLQVVDYVSINSGTAAISHELLADWFVRPGDTYLQVTTEPGVDKEQIQPVLAAAAEGATTMPTHVYTGEQGLNATKASVEQSGAFAIAIQWIVAVVAAIALLNTLLLSVIERKRELGVLRAMGASRKFVQRMVLAEAAAVAAVGSLLGVVMGTALHLVGNKILTQSTAVDVVYSPQALIVVYVVIAFGLCFAGAFFPAARAGRMNISESLLTE
ncbi:FtsX-like permease family protein [Williamsia sp.]|uniref:FtsX-like permease family protein n=1 Tax=Williamsia sp. TaxID=1872085 RepID=UPI002F927499